MSPIPSLWELFKTLEKNGKEKTVKSERYFTSYYCAGHRLRREYLKSYKGYK